jgi:hypothetical protein
MEAFGAPRELILEMREQVCNPFFEVFEDCWESVELFCALGSQWRIIAGMGGAFWQGLDYTAIEPCLRLRGVPRKRWAAFFDDLQIMQTAAAAVLNERKAN